MIVLSEYTNKNKKTSTDSKYLNNLDEFKNSQIYNDISIEAKENSPLKKLERATKERIGVRKAVDKGEMKVGNIEEAQKTNRIAAINDLYRGLLASQTKEDGTPVYNISKLSDPSYSGYIKDPDFYDMVKYEISQGARANEKLSALENYVEKGGYPNKVFDYLTSVGGKMTNVYGIDEEKFKEKSGKGLRINKEEVEKTRAENPSRYDEGDIAAARFLSKPLETSLSLANLGIKGLNALGVSDWIRNKQYKEWEGGTTEEYNKYKEGKLGKESGAYSDPFISGGKELSRVNLYKAYDEAKSNGFKGSVEEYANYAKDLDRYITDLKIEEGQHLIDEELIDTNKKAIVADTAGEVVEMLLMERALKGIGIFQKGGNIINTSAKTGRLKSLLNTTKHYGKEMLKNISNFFVDTVRGTTEVLTLEAAKQGELPSSEEAGTTAAITAGLEALVRLPGMYSFFKNSLGDAAKSLYKIPESAYDAIGSQTKQQRGHKINVVENSFGLHPKTTPKQELGGKWNKAASELKSSLRKQEQNLKNLRQNIKGTTKPEDIIKPIEKDVGSLNGEMTKLSEMGELSVRPDKVPLFDINGEGVMEIHNKETLNAYKSKDGVGLGDAIERLWNDTFANGAMERNAATADAFVSDLEKLIYDFDLSGSTKSNSLKDIFVNRIKSAKKTIREGMDAGTLAELEKAEKKYAESRNLEDAVDKYILGSSSNSKYMTELAQTEIGKNVGEGGDVIRIIAEKLKKGGYTDEDLIAETVAYAYALALKDPQAAAALIEEMYPSVPGLREYFLQAFRRKALEETASQIVKQPAVQNTAKELGGVWNTIKGAVRKTPLIGGYISTKTRGDENISNEDIWAEEDLYSY